MPLFPFAAPEHGLLGFIDETGHLVIEQRFAPSAHARFGPGGFCILREAGAKSESVIDTTGALRLTLTPGLSSLLTPPDEHGILAVRHDLEHDNPDAWQLDGHEVLYTGPSRHYAMHVTGEIAFEGHVVQARGGVYVVKVEQPRLFGLCDRSGTFLLPPVYDSLSMSSTDPVVVAVRDGMAGLMDWSGAEIIPLVHPVSGFHDTPIAEEGRFIHLDPKRGVCPILDLGGRMVGETPPTRWSDLYPRAVPRLSDGLMQIAGLDRAGQEVFGYRDADGAPAMTGWSGRPRVFGPDRRPGYFHDGRATLRRGGLTGYIDRDGNEVIPPRYDSAGDFEKGLAKVHLTKADRLAGRYCYIDREGQTVACNH